MRVLRLTDEWVGGRLLGNDGAYGEGLFEQKDGISRWTRL